MWKLVQAYNQTQLLPVTHFSAHKHASLEYSYLPMSKSSQPAVPTIQPRYGTSMTRLPLPQTPNQRRSPSKPPWRATNEWVWDCAFGADSAYLVTACAVTTMPGCGSFTARPSFGSYNGHHRGCICVALNDYSKLGRTRTEDHPEQQIDLGHTKKMMAGVAARVRGRKKAQGGTVSGRKRKPPRATPFQVSNSKAGQGMNGTADRGDATKAQIADAALHLRTSRRYLRMSPTLVTLVTHRPPG